MERVQKVTVSLYGSLACTGEGHATPQAILMGLEGESPEEVDPSTINPRFNNIQQTKKLSLMGKHPIHFDYAKGIFVEALRHEH